MNLFDKAIIFTDIHFGLSSNSEQHNKDCLDFVNWMISIAKEKNIKTGIFLGDWHDNRHTIHVNTLNYSITALSKINEYFKQFYFIPGNHDLFYRHRRDVSSTEIAIQFQNIKIINDFITTGNVTFCPWLLENEENIIKDLAKKSDYMFGHFELPEFIMNASVAMPYNSGFNKSWFDDVTYYAFSGHFHKRQIKNKVCYIGNAFSHSFSDVWDDDRGVMILSWGNLPEFIKWPVAPKFRAYMLSDILSDPSNTIDDKTSANISNDIDLSFDELQFIKEALSNNYNPRKLNILSIETQIDDDDQYSPFDNFQNTEQIVVEGLQKIDSLTMSKEILMEIYNSL